MRGRTVVMVAAVVLFSLGYAAGDVRPHPAIPVEATRSIIIQQKDGFTTASFDAQQAFGSGQVKAISAQTWQVLLKPGQNVSEVLDTLNAREGESGSGVA